MQLKRLIFMTFLTAGVVYAANPTKSIISMEYGSGQIAQTYGTSALSDDRDITKYGLKIGAVEDIKRLFLSYRYHKVDNLSQPETTGYSISLEYDGMATEGGSGFFMGLILGYESYDFLGQDGNVRTQSDIIYGLDGGLTVLFLNNYGFDIGVRYTLPLTETKNNGVASQPYKIAETTTSYISFNYLY